MDILTLPQYSTDGRVVVRINSEEIFVRPAFEEVVVTVRLSH